MCVYKYVYIYINIIYSCNNTSQLLSFVNPPSPQSCVLVYTVRAIGLCAPFNSGFPTSPSVPPLPNPSAPTRLPSLSTATKPQTNEHQL